MVLKSRSHIKTQENSKTKPGEQLAENEMIPNDVNHDLIAHKTANKHSSATDDLLADISISRKERRNSQWDFGFGKQESYVKHDKLGQGTYATVFKGWSRLMERDVALKEIQLEQEEGTPCTAIREVSLLRGLRHANIVTLHDLVHTSNTLILVFEFVQSDLRRYMERCPNNQIPIHNSRIFIYQLLRGLLFCHRQLILHRDLKPHNVLINEKGELKLADFGLARSKSVPIKTCSNEVVTLWYRPPDVLLGSVTYSIDIDMWGVGCILFEMIAGRPLFPGNTIKDQLTAIFNCLGPPKPTDFPEQIQERTLNSLGYSQPQKLRTIYHKTPNLSSSSGNLVTCCLSYNRNMRLTAAQAMSHPFITESLPVTKLCQLGSLDSIFDCSDVLMIEDRVRDCQLLTHT